MDKAQATPSSDTKKIPEGGTITTKINQDGSKTVIYDGLNGVHIGQTASFLVTPSGFFQAPRASQQSSAVNKTAASAMGGQMIVIKDSKDVRIGNNVSLTSVMSKKKKSKGNKKTKESVDKPEMKAPQDDAAVPSQSQMRP